MIQIKNYKIISELYISSNIAIYKAVRLEDNKKVIIKLLSKEYPSTEELNKLKHEYDIARSLSNVNGVIKVYDFLTVKNSYAFVMEDIEGVSLDKLIKSIDIDVKLFLVLSVNITKILGEIHNNNIIHKDIKPSNIIVNLKTNKVKIIDFSISSELLRENQEVIHPDHLEGTLAYISPEQTGRMNRSIDYRSDYYSLGITFYEMLVKKLPFYSYDPIELVHEHIAKEAIEPHKINNEIPKVISNIIKKMMAKNAEDRYQSSSGLIKDLQNCINQLTSKNKINNFILGKFDISEKFHVPEKLFGRNKEIEILTETFDKILKGNKEIIFISGSAGVGKTSLINEIQKPVLKNKGFFVTGKFEQYKKSIPYFGISQALHELIKYILTEKSENLKIWNDKIMKVVGFNGQLMINLIPELELIIGKQPEIQRLSFKDYTNRLIIVFTNFIKLFTDQNHPLVLFIDDLQWADSDSLSLLEQLLYDIELKYFLFVGSYREKENDASQINTFIKKIKQRINVIDMNIKSLTIEDVILLVNGTIIKTDKKIILELSNLIINKTMGNPFFIKEFLKSLYERKVINFDNKQTVDLKKIRKFEISDNVIEVMSERILSLGSDVLNILRIAACIGTMINLKLLANLNNINEQELLLKLRNIINSGVLIKTKTYIKFIHDRVREIVYSTLSDLYKKKIHYQIGKLLLDEYIKKKDEELIYNITYQLNLCKDLLNNDEKKILRELNYEAGIRAKATASFNSASSLFTNNEDLLLNDAWINDYNFTLNYFTEWAETEYIMNNIKKANLIIDDVIKNSKETIDKVRVYQIIINYYSIQMQFDKAIELGIKIINELNYKFPKTKDINFIKILIEIIKFNILIKKKEKELKVDDITDLYDLPVTKDRKINEILNILLTIGQPFFSMYKDKYPYIVLKVSNIALKHGLTNYYFGGFMPLASIFIVGLKNYEMGYKLGLLDLKLLEKSNSKHLKSFSKFMFSILVNHFKMHIKDSIPLLIEAYNDGLNSGNNQYAAYSINHLCIRYLIIEKDLESVNFYYNKYSTVQKRLKQLDADTFFYPTWQFVNNLLNLCNDKFKLIGEYFNEQKEVEIMKKHNHRSGLGIYYTLKLILLFILNDYKNCLYVSYEGLEYMNENMGTIHNYFFIFFICLTYLRNMNVLNKNERNKHLKFIKKNIAEFEILSNHCSQNFKHFYLLLSAEYCQYKNRINQAMILYDQAIKCAKENEYVLIEAVANELASKFYNKYGMNKIFQTYLIEAFYCYIKWGAKSKIEELQKEYPELFNYLIKGENTNIDVIRKTLSTVSYPVYNKPSTFFPIKSFDISSILKATQIISSEINMDSLLKALVKIVIENAGAQKGIFIINKKNKLFIEAYTNVQNKDIIVLQSVPINESNDLSQAVINYVYRTKEIIKLDDALNKGLFINDAYIQENKVKSVLCMPIIFQNSLSGILYLENNLAAGSFTDEHLEVLNIISSQAAISIHNIYLYESIKEKELLEKELKLASDIQKSMLPDKLPEIKGYEISNYCIMSKEAGGDLYDVIKINDNNYLIVIGDVSGKGLSAALYMSSVINMLRLLIVSYIHKEEAFFQKNFLRNLLEQLNVVLKNIMKKDSFVTLFIGLLNNEKNLLKYTSSGHVPAYYFNPKKRKLIILKTKGMACGSLSSEIYNQRIEQKEIKLDKNCFVFFITDGILEARNQEEIEYSERFLDIIRTLKNKDNSFSIINRLINDYKNFTKNEPYFDDLTLICLKRKEKKQYNNKINDLYLQVKKDFNEYFSKTIKDVNQKDFLRIKKGIIFDFNEEESFLKLAITTNCFPIPLQLTLIQTIFQDLLSIITKDKGLVTDILIVIDEVISNIIEHSYKNSGDELIIFDFLFYNNKLVLIIKDFGQHGDKLDIEKEGIFESKDYLIKNVIKTKRGMGIYMIKKIMDDVYYECKDGKINILTLTKNYKNVLYKI
ncbi:MAG: AAA family ATPase [Spirochaetes bacterium]|nr:AAA family ATPase [Spirochaetota bacterium]